MKNETKLEPVHVCYHSADLDGHCSGYLCRQKLLLGDLNGFRRTQPLQIRPHGVDYGEPVPEDEDPDPEDLKTTGKR